MLRCTNTLALAGLMALTVSCANRSEVNEATRQAMHGEANEATREAERKAELDEIAQTLSSDNVSTAFDREYGRIIVESEFDAADGLPIRFKWYEHIGREEAYVVFINGRAEFLEKHDALFTDRKEFPSGVSPAGETLADLPITFVALDVSGQGGSKKGRVASHIDNFDVYVDDVRRLFSTVSKLERHRKPVYLMAHSQGGLVAARFAQTYPDLIDGLIVLAPFWGFVSRPELPAEVIRGVADFYASTVGLPKLCSRPDGVAPETLVAIAQCVGGALGEACTACFANPASCTDETGIGLLTAFQQLQAIGDKGCNDFGFECPLPVLTDNDAFCEFISEHPRSGPAPSMGYLSAAFAAHDAFNQGPAIAVPTLILSNPNDVIVDGSTHTCDKFSGPCEVITYETPAHELLTGLRRADAVSAIREYLGSRMQE